MAKRSPYDAGVFINVPFDAAYAPFRRALIFTIFDCGYVPRCALERSDGGEVRFSKIEQLVRASRQSIHDISRAGVDPNSGLARFNMPLELGLCLGAARFGSGLQRKKRCLIMDRERYRYQKFCSDIAGQDIVSHEGRVDILIRKVRDWLAGDAARRRVVVPGGGEIRKRYQAFRRVLPGMCRIRRLDAEELTYLDYNTLVAGWLQSNP